MYEDRYVEDTIGIKIQVLDVVVPEKTFEEIIGRECQSTLHESGEHWNLIRILLYWIRVASGGTLHIHLILSQEPAVDQGKQIISLQFGFLPFLGRVGMRRRWR
jgi:hypothetical protein